MEKTEFPFFDFPTFWHSPGSAADSQSIISTRTNGFASGYEQEVRKPWILGDAPLPYFTPGFNLEQEAMAAFPSEARTCTSGSRGPAPLVPKILFKIMQFSGNFKGKTPILSKFWAHGPSSGVKTSLGPHWPKSWIHAWREAGINIGSIWLGAEGTTGAPVNLGLREQLQRLPKILGTWYP